MPKLEITQLEEIVGVEGVLRDECDLLVYERDASLLRGTPLVILQPTKTKQVAEILKLANQTKTPVVARGAGTGLTGGAVPIRESIVIDFSRMNRILEIDENNFTALVEPGVVHGTLNRELNKQGLFFPPDPASSTVCTIGGCVAENAGGLHAVKYGVTTQWVKGLEVVLPSGEIMWTGAYPIKSVAGYDLTRLFCGSEGTLGVFTKILLQVAPLPVATSTTQAFFETAKRAGECVYALIKAGLDPSTVEFMDRATTDAVTEFAKLDLRKGQAMLIIEVDGNPEEVQRKTRELAQYLDVFASEYTIAKTPEEGHILKMARQVVYPAAASRAPTILVEDFAVPISKIPEIIEYIETIREELVEGISFFVIGHAGDGNLHVFFTFDEEIPGRLETVQELGDKIMRKALALGGTVAAEHGIGLLKTHLLPEEHDTVALRIMQGLKKFFDPNNILNPGKIFPLEDE